MKRLPLLFPLVLLFLGCATPPKAQLPADNAVNYLISFPGPGGLVFMGASGPQLKPEMEIEAAREDAARKVSMYHGVQARYSSVQSSGTNALSYYSDSNLQMQYDEVLDPYKEKLTYNPERDVMYGHGTVFVRFTYPGNFPVNITYKSSLGSDGKPVWIKHPPVEISGFMAQVGFARRHQRIRDAVAKASEDAVTQLISRSSSRLRTSDSTTNDQNTTFVSQRSRGSLQYFMILETWIDPKDLSVWILTIAKDVIQ